MLKAASSWEDRRKFHNAFGDIDTGPTKHWMLANRNAPKVRPKFDLAFGKRPEEELYDLNNDPDYLQNVANDYYVNVVGIWEDLDKRYLEEVPSDVRSVCDGYAAGINKYAKDNPKSIYKKLYPLKGVDIVAGFMHRTPLFYGMGGVLRKLLGSKPPTLIGHKSNDDKDKMQMHASNVFAVSPNRSSDGYTRLIVNSHQPWSGPVAWYEAHISSDDGWDIITGLFPGSPVGLVGHNPDLGWSHTVNDLSLIHI